MKEVLELFDKNNKTIPIIIAGAATSKLYTALKLEPVYKKSVFYTTDASSTVVLLDSLLGEASKIFKEKISQFV